MLQALGCTIKVSNYDLVNPSASYICDGTVEQRWPTVRTARTLSVYNDW